MTVARERGNTVRRERAAVRALGQVQPCIRCGRQIDLDVQLWDLGHIIGIAEGGGNERSNKGPEHVRCNRSAGGKLGKMRQVEARAESRRGRGMRRW